MRRYDKYSCNAAVATWQYIPHFVWINYIKLDASMGQSNSLPVEIDTDDKNQLLARGYRLHHGRCALATLAIILTFGLLLIPILWRKDFKMFMFYKECPLQHASKVLIKVELVLSLFDGYSAPITFSSALFIITQSFCNIKI